MEMIANIEAEVKYFKKKLVRAIHIFFELKNKYEHDDDSVMKQIKVFKEFLKQFGEKYQNIVIFLDDTDFTPDDFKIFILNYTKQEDILEKYKMTVSPLLVKVNKKYQKLQAYLNYEYLDVNLSQDLEFLAMIALERYDKNKKIIFPPELEKIGFMSNRYSAKDCVFSSGRPF